MSLDTAATCLKAGGIVVVRTETLYGIIACADNQWAVEKVFQAKGRNDKKPCIVLLDSADSAPEAHRATIARVTSDSDRPVSIIIPRSNEPEWITRGGDSVAYRVTSDGFLKELIGHVGPVVAPSANPEGREPAGSVVQAREYFGDAVDVYVDGGAVPTGAVASRIVRIETDGHITTVRS